MDIRYNDIQFAIVSTREFSFNREMSPDGITYLYTRVHIDVEGILNPQAMSYPSTGIYPPDSVIAIRHTLEQPRGQLIISSKTGTIPVMLLTRPETGEVCDCNNGPIPGSCMIRPEFGGRTWYIRWSCDTWIRECPAELFALISNRWSQSDRVDDQYRSVRTTTGIAVFRTDLMSADNSSLVADDFRADVVPPVPRGFRRTSVNVHVVPSRNALQWACTDEETFYDLGDTQASLSFITKAQVHMQMSTLTVQGQGQDNGIPCGQALVNLRVHLWGDKRASEWTMLQRAFGLAAGVLPLGDINQGYIANMVLGKDLADRQIDLNIAFKLNPPAGAPMAGLPANILRVDNVFGDFAGLNPSPPAGKGSRGTSNIKVLAAALEAACGGDADTESAFGDDAITAQYDTNSPAFIITVGDEIPTQQTRYKPNPDGNPGPYNHYEIKSRYERYQHRMQAPSTGPPPSGADPGHSDPVTGGWVYPPWPSTTFQLAAPTAQLIVEWSAERIGHRPQAPHPNNADPNLILLHDSIVPFAPPVMPDGQNGVFRIEGTYIYALKKAYDLTKALSVGVLPWVAAAFFDTSYEPEDFQHNIIDTTSGNYP